MQVGGKRTRSQFTLGEIQCSWRTIESRYMALRVPLEFTNQHLKSLLRLTTSALAPSQWSPTRTVKMPQFTIPPEFAFTYHPDPGFAPIHEITEGRNKRIKALPLV